MTQTFTETCIFSSIKSRCVKGQAFFEGYCNVALFGWHIKQLLFTPNPTLPVFISEKGSWQCFSVHSLGILRHGVAFFKIAAIHVPITHFYEIVVGDQLLNHLIRKLH